MRLSNTVSVHSFFFFFNIKSDINKSDESPRYEHILALYAFFFNKVVSNRLFLRKFVFDVCVFCFMFGLRLILWILKNFAVSGLLCGIRRTSLDVCFVSGPDVILYG